LLGGLIWVAFPWAFDIHAPGMAQAERRQNVFASYPAQVVALQNAGPVKAGTTLASFNAPDVQARDLRTEAQLTSLQQRLKGIAVEDSGMDFRQVTRERLVEQLAESRATQDELGRLSVKAEFDGVWLDVDHALQPGTWVGTKNQVGVLVAPGAWIVDAYVDQTDAERIQPGAPAAFRPRGQWMSVAATVVDVDSTRSTKLPHPMLDANHGGPIATHSGDRQAMPLKTLYRVRLSLAEPLTGGHETPGQATIEGARQSLAWLVAQKVAAVLIRESGF